MKVCTKCGVEKEDDLFRLLKQNNKSGQRYYSLRFCKECEVKSGKEYDKRRDPITRRKDQNERAKKRGDSKKKWLKIKNSKDLLDERNKYKALFYKKHSYKINKKFAEYRKTDNAKRLERIRKKQEKYLIIGRNNSKKHVINISDKYIKDQLKRKKIPSEYIDIDLIEIYRLIIKMKRLCQTQN
jgi:hypothetical protein